jgi:hypothetical protein
VAHDRAAPRGRATRAAAIKAWEAGETLPEGFHRFDLEAATKAWAAGVKRWGSGWFEDVGDGMTYDWALQIGVGVTSEIKGETEARYG